MGWLLAPDRKKLSRTTRPSSMRTGPTAGELLPCYGDGHDNSEEADLDEELLAINGQGDCLERDHLIGSK
jgi:hypothetical protein